MGRITLVSILEDLDRIYNPKYEDVYNAIDDGHRPFIFFDGSRDNYSGLKLSLQGKTTDDAKELYTLLGDWLKSKNVPFKVGTSRLINSKNVEQRTKLMTIYVPNNEDITDFMEQVYTRVRSYKGWHDIPLKNLYQHYAGAVYYRNDRDENDEYIPAS